MHNIQLKFIAFSFWKNSFIVHVFFVLIFIEVQLIYNIVNATGVHQSFQILFWYKSLKSIEQSSLCYAVGPYQLSILYLVVCICQSQFPNCPSTSYPQETMFVFYIGTQGCLERGVRISGSYQQRSRKSGSFRTWHHP